MIEKLIKLNLVYDCEYLDKYKEIIAAGQQIGYIKYKTHKHHIIPKSYFKWNGLAVDNSKSNIVYLLAKDHVLAHYYLALAACDADFKYQNELAFTYMTNRRHFTPNEIEVLRSLEHYQEMYEEACKTRALKNKGKEYPESAKIRLKEIMLEREYKPEWVEAIKRGVKANPKKYTTEWRENQSKTISGRKSITKDGVFKLVKADELDVYLADGWEFGSKTKGKRKPNGFGRKVSASSKGKVKSADHKEAISKARTHQIAINNGETTKYINKDLAEEFLNSGWKLGTTFDYGHTKNQERCSKISEKNKQRKHFTNGVDNVFISSEEIAKYEAMGWWNGRTLHK